MGSWFCDRNTPLNFKESRCNEYVILLEGIMYTVF